jgi:hypothetical protein
MRIRLHGREKIEHKKIAKTGEKCMMKLKKYVWREKEGLQQQQIVCR